MCILNAYQFSKVQGRILGGGKRGKFRQGGATGGGVPPLKFSGRGRNPLIFFQGGADFICPPLNINVDPKSKNQLDIFSIIFSNFVIENNFSVIKSPENLTILGISKFRRASRVFSLLSTLLLPMTHTTSKGLMMKELNIKSNVR